MFFTKNCAAYLNISALVSYVHVLTSYWKLIFSRYFKCLNYEFTIYRHNCKNISAFGTYGNFKYKY